MVTDAQLQAAIQADPFHQAMELAQEQPDFNTVADILEQLFPNTDTKPSAVWDLPASNTKRATFKPSSLRPAKR